MPTVLEKSQEFNKAVVHVTVSTAGKVAGVVRDGVQQAFTIARDTGATVVGQARSATERTFDQAAAGTREVVGQVRSQGRRAGDELDDLVDRTGERAVDAVDPAPSSGTPYEHWTKSELYERAQELAVEGRSAMSKDELIAALRSH